MDPEVLPEPTSLARCFGTAQLDPNLINTQQQVAAVDGRPIEGVNKVTYPYFAIKNQLLYQVIMKQSEP